VQTQRNLEVYSVFVSSLILRPLNLLDWDAISEQASPSNDSTLEDNRSNEQKCASEFWDSLPKLLAIPTTGIARSYVIL